MLCLAWLDRMKWWQLGFGVVGVAAVSLGALINIPLLRDRMFHRPPENVAEAAQNLNVSGRDVLWGTTAVHAIQKPVIGWGPGTSRPLLAPLFAAKGDRRSVEYSPHNEYLQVFHDLGAVGVTLLVWAWVPFLIASWVQWKRAVERSDLGLAKWYMATTLGTVVVLANSVVDNTLHYAQVIAPLFIIAAAAEVMQSQRAAAVNAGGGAVGVPGAR